MNEDNLAGQQSQEAVEAARISFRILELHDDPIRGNFDLRHLKAIHAYIFQDFPQHRPGIIRGDTAKSWIKHRSLEGISGIYSVRYASQKIAAKITAILRRFGGAVSIKGLPLPATADRMATLYGDLDHAHGFYEGNSRTLREFTRQMATEAGCMLDWSKTGSGAQARNKLYLARDLAVLERAFPGLTPEKAMQTSDRDEYEASFRIEKLRRDTGENTLAAIFRAALS